jgi:hypothetical protein
MPAVIPGRRHEPAPGCPAGTVLVPDDMDLHDYVRLLRDAARASAITWGEPMGQGGCDRALHHLGIAVQDLQIFVMKLAGRLRLSAFPRPEPAGTAQVAAVTASVRALGRAWLLLDEILPADAAPVYSACVPADLLCFAARRIAARWPPAAGLEEIVVCLADALAALEAGTACLAVGAAHPVATCLAGVRDCLQVAASQLRNVREPAAPAIAARERRPGSPS